MAKRITLEYCGMPGSGATVTEAKADAARQLTALANDTNLGPRLVVAHGVTAIIFRDLNGWAYRILRPDVDKTGRLFGTCGGMGSEVEVTRFAACHIAQNEWTAAVADDRAFAETTLDASLARGAERETAIRELCRWFAFQRGYIACKAQGLSDDAARVQASRDSWNATA